MDSFSLGFMRTILEGNFVPWAIGKYGGVLTWKLILIYHLKLHDLSYILISYFFSFDLMTML